MEVLEEFIYMQEGGKNYIKSNIISEDDYITGMLINNEIRGLVPATFKSLNGQSYICYYMNGLIPLEQSLQIHKLTGNRVEALLKSLILAYNSMEDFLLPFDRLVVSKKYIYENYNKKNEFLWIYGNSRQSMSFTGLFEYLLDKIEYKDDKAVKFLYSLYQVAKDSERLFNNESDMSAFTAIKEKAEEMLITPSLDETIQQNIKFNNVSGYENNFKYDNYKHDEEITRRENDFRYDDMEYKEEFRQRKNKFNPYRAYSSDEDREFIRKVRVSEEAFDREFYNEQEEEIEETVPQPIKSKNLKDRFFKGKKVVGKKREIGKKGKTEKSEISNSKVKDTFKKVWKYLNADIGSKNIEEVESDLVKEEVATYNVRTIKPVVKKRIEKEPIEKPTTLLSGGIIENGIYCLAPYDNTENNILLTEYPFFIGKADNNVNAQIDDSTVSRYHARIDKEDEDFYVTDLNSTNGTFLNGIRLLPYDRVTLKRGDVVVISRKRYEFKFLG